MDISFDEVVVSGTIGGLGLGMSPSSVREALGRPEGVSSSRETPIWKYGGFQVSFWNDRVFILCLYFPGEEVAPEGLRWEDWEPLRPISLEDFQARLRLAGAEFRTDPALTFDDQLCVAVGKTVRAVFTRRDDQYRLRSICVRRYE